MCKETEECKYSIEVLHIKILSPLVKHDSIYILHLILVHCGLWVFDVVERGIERVHSEFHHE